MCFYDYFDNFDDRNKGRTKLYGTGVREAETSFMFQVDTIALVYIHRLCGLIKLSIARFHSKALRDMKHVPNRAPVS